MLIARTQEESDAYVEQEISHCLRLNKKPNLLVEDGETWLVDNIRGCLAQLPVFKPVTTMKTKKYGVLVVMDSIRDLLESKYNKAILLMYCNNVVMRKTKRSTLRVVSFTTLTEDVEFEEREFSNSGGLYINEITKIEKHEGFLLVVERNKYSVNGCQVIDTFKLKREDNLYTN
jgi:hypothetical protein